MADYSLSFIVYAIIFIFLALLVFTLSIVHEKKRTIYHVTPEEDEEDEEGETVF